VLHGIYIHIYVDIFYANMITTKCACFCRFSNRKTDN